MVNAVFFTFSNNGTDGCLWAFTKDLMSVRCETRLCKQNIQSRFLGFDIKAAFFFIRSTCLTKTSGIMTVFE